MAHFLIGLIYMCLNTFTLLLYALDKYRAGFPQGKNRIPEKWLLFSSFMFGALGAIIAMELTRHKTDSRTDPTKRAFTVGVPFAYLCQVAMVFCYGKYHDDIRYIACTVLYFAVFSVFALTWKSSKARNKGSAGNIPFRQAEDYGGEEPPYLRFVDEDDEWYA